MSGAQLKFGEDERSVALKRAWEHALKALSDSINKFTFESCIRPLRPLSFDGHTVTLGAPSSFVMDWLIKKRYVDVIGVALEHTLEVPIEVHLRLLNPDELAAPAPAAEPEPKKQPARGRGAPKQAAEDPFPSLPLNERYTFENFVVGRSNRLAQAAAMAVAESPGTVYNPLFVYGGSGLGKTHLLHAIGHAARQRSASVRVALIDGENFTQHFVSALRERRTEEFRRRFRSIDIWLVDDIQFIAGREQTKEEFFHTFNALYQTGKQIVISSDRSPRELRTMDVRLRSRFEAGLIADVNVPELETRVAILDHRCREENWNVPGDVVFYVASAIQSNIRTLEGALTKLVAYSSIMRQTLSLELAQDVLAEYYVDMPPPGVSAKDVPVEGILRAVSERFGTTVEALRGQRRDKDTALARQVAMHLCRTLTQMPLADIGAAIGRRDHSTVQRGIARVDSMLPYDAGLLQTIQELRGKLER